MNREHKNRLVAGALGLCAIFGIYFSFGHRGLLGLVILFSTLAYLEFLRFFTTSKAQLVLPLLLSVFLSFWLCVNPEIDFIPLYFGILILVAQGLWIVHRDSVEALSQNYWHTQAQVFGLVYLIFLPTYVPKIHALEHGPTYLIFLMSIIWLGDTSAYYGGKLLGKNKLSLNISPGKTREGALTALAASAILAIAFHSFGWLEVPMGRLIFLALSTSVVAQAGDLIESLIKRAYQVKDSGSLIPGHGGVFDRFDSVILAAPFFYFLVRFLG